jgi:hypothetical protein
VQLNFESGHDYSAAAQAPEPSVGNLICMALTVSIAGKMMWRRKIKAKI